MFQLAKKIYNNNNKERNEIGKTLFANPVIG